VKPKLASWRISNFSLMSVRCVSFRNAPCSRSSFLKGLGNIPSSWPIIRAKTPRREREILGTLYRLHIDTPSRRPISPEPFPRRKLTPPLLRSSRDAVPAAAAVLAVFAAGAPDLAMSTFNVRPPISWLLNFLTRSSGSKRQGATTNRRPSQTS